MMMMTTTKIVVGMGVIWFWDVFSEVERAYGIEVDDIVSELERLTIQLIASSSLYDYSR
jgi:hypothetical protein